MHELFVIKRQVIKHERALFRLQESVIHDCMLLSFWISQIQGVNQKLEHILHRLDFL